MRSKIRSLVYNIIRPAYVFSGIAAVMSNKDAYSKIFNVLNYLKFLTSPSRVKDSSRGTKAEGGTALSISLLPGRR